MAATEYKPKHKRVVKWTKKKNFFFFLIYKSVSILQFRSFAKPARNWIHYSPIFLAADKFRQRDPEILNNSQRGHTVYTFALDVFIEQEMCLFTLLPSCYYSD